MENYQNISNITFSDLITETQVMTITHTIIQIILLYNNKPYFFPKSHSCRENGHSQHFYHQNAAPEGELFQQILSNKTHDAGKI